MNVFVFIVVSPVFALNPARSPHTDGETVYDDGEPRCNTHPAPTSMPHHIELFPAIGVAYELRAPTDRASTDGPYALAHTWFASFVGPLGCAPASNVCAREYRSSRLCACDGRHSSPVLRASPADHGGRLRDPDSRRSTRGRDGGSSAPSSTAAQLKSGLMSQSHGLAHGQSAWQGPMKQAAASASRGGGGVLLGGTTVVGAGKRRSGMWPNMARSEVDACALPQNRTFASLRRPNENTPETQLARKRTRGIRWGLHDKRRDYSTADPRRHTGSSFPPVTGSRSEGSTGHHGACCAG
ncbi:hypothetical protein GGX14DRAFT_391855 [Mycena pura]|uniref:Uncharacterized protein n=1 Tax=Mycena pura TaxID=153505 RepID=A0AAD6YI61_9AGAR|nr:hypothetical protein GGX14DRAFT_391855 [Mycena pura]